jgi:hypothetical protein
MISTISFDQPFGFQDVENFYAEFADLLTNSSIRNIRYDLTRVEFIQPEFLLALIATAKIWYQKKGKPVEWKCDLSLLTYLGQIGIFQILRRSIRVDDFMPGSLLQSTGYSLMEVQHIASEPQQNSIDVSQISEICLDLFLGRVRSKQLPQLMTLLSEITQNIIHSQSSGYAYAQSFDNERVHLGVIDTGIGIPASLASEYPHLTKPSDYLRKSLELGVTSGIQTNGLGLYRVQQIVEANGGVLVIRSNSAMLRLNTRGVEQWDALTYIPGTQVFATVWGLHNPTNWNYDLQ